eukprot:3909415-Rhodomonas_salina.3
MALINGETPPADATVMTQTQEHGFDNIQQGSPRDARAQDTLNATKDIGERVSSFNAAACRHRTRQAR